MEGIGEGRTTSGKRGKEGFNSKASGDLNVTLFCRPRGRGALQACFYISTGNQLAFHGLMFTVIAFASNH